MQAKKVGWHISLVHSRDLGLDGLRRRLIIIINCPEMLAMLYGLQSYVADMVGVHVKLLTDNTTAMMCINNQGSVRSEACNAIARQIWYIVSSCIQGCHS